MGALAVGFLRKITQSAGNRQEDIGETLDKCEKKV
jgi:hypothetical protein